MSSPNIAHSDKWRLLFSNIPGYVPNVESNTDNMSLYDLFVKGVTFPAYTLELVQSNLGAYQINHPISKKNDNLGTVDVTFKLSEGMLNYYYIVKWIQELREGINSDKEKWFRLNVIKEMKLFFMDNMKRDVFKYIFEKCYITDVGSLSLTNGSDVELEFTVSISYENFRIEPGEC